MGETVGRSRNTDAFGMDIPRELKSGTFVPSDVPVVKRALAVYAAAIKQEYTDHDDLTKIADLLSRLN